MPDGHSSHLFGEETFQLEILADVNRPHAFKRDLDQAVPGIVLHYPNMVRLHGASLDPRATGQASKILLRGLPVDLDVVATHNVFRLQDLLSELPVVS